MVGYPESLTDPSYCAQILVLTYPLIGNYGVPEPAMNEVFGVPDNAESRRIWAGGLIVGNACDSPCHWASSKSLHQWLLQEGVPGIQDIDTRALTMKIREKGSILGKIILEGETDIPFKDPNKENLVERVSIKSPKVINPKGDVRITVVDCGLKFNQIRCLVKRGACVTILPWDHPINPEEYDALFISNGPGDPQICQKVVEGLKKVLLSSSKPIFGICLGHQLLSVAAGASTFKMKYGNRGHNQPCVHAGTDRCYITSQNHGYAVDSASLPPAWESLFVNKNDKTNEGIVHKSKPFFR
ncbi:UNVERIFIED_CONTAM: hypothetical protein GTU68_030929 [Idotea baltica]|nr:hypothetical protein [Idotea baltica]